MRHEEFLDPYLPKNRQRLAINVGAHDGLWVQKFAPLFDNVIAIEANPDYTSKLRKLGLDNLEVMEAAAWICSGQRMEFNIRDGIPMQSALAVRDLMRTEQISRKVDAPTISIDDIPKQACDLIWCDVEGAEVQVMMGATLTVEAFHPQLVIECHEIEHRDWLTTWLRRAGYNLAVVHNPNHDQGDSRWDRNTHLIAQHWRYRGTW